MIDDVKRATGLGSRLSDRGRRVMRFLSLFSGIEAASCAWHPLGWEAVAFAEVDPFASAVLAHHYPGVPNLGDVTAVTQQQIATLGRIDVVVFGFPCQDLSVAGLRKGLVHDDGRTTRSGLFFDAMRIVEWSGARWAVAENVPGLFSSKGGRDFAAVVGAMAGADADVPDGGWRNTGVVAGASGLVEWSVLDAQWFGLAQRRKRVFLVRDTGEWASRPPVLFERESLSGHPAPRREAGQVAPTVPSRRTAGDGLGSDFDCDGWLIPSVAGCLETTSHDYSRADGFTMIAHTVRAVRRLTPRELERLQGFSDDYTLIPYRGKPAADGNRYKALGNSMAVPVMRWIGERIAEVEGVA